MNQILTLLLVASSLFSFAQSPCNLTLTVQTGDCTSNASYQVWLNYTVQSPSAATQFVVYANGQSLGQFPMNNTGTIYIPNFPYNGGANDVVKICLSSQPDCCVIKEFPVPACLTNTPVCQVELSATTGQCAGDSTYQLNLQVQVTTSVSSTTSYQIWVNNVSVGTFPITQNSVSLPNTKWNGGINDVVKVCVTNQSSCCKIVEYAVPTCLTQPPAPCNLNLDALVGECTGDSTYSLTVKAQIVATSATQTWSLWHNGVQIGTYPASQTTIVIPNAHWNGGNNDVIKACLTNQPDCCKIVEFPVPTCLTQPPTPCHLSLEAVTGDCTSDSTYHLTVQTQITAASATQTWSLWHNGVQIGTYPASQTTVVIPNAIWNGGNHDAIKACLTDLPNCCKIVEFEVPDCLLVPPCEIGPLNVQPTACLCGQFFAVIHFQTNQPNSGQFTVSGNGTTYGTWSYGQLPIIIGPLTGNGATPYKFIVRDLAHPDCSSDDFVGTVNCPLFASFDPVMRISPNPANHYIQVDFPDAAADSDATLDISNQLGQVVMEKQLNRVSTTFCDISALAEGKYQVRIKWAGGSSTAQFVKAK